MVIEVAKQIAQYGQSIVGYRLKDASFSHPIIQRCISTCNVISKSMKVSRPPNFESVQRKLKTGSNLVGVASASTKNNRK